MVSLDGGRENVAIAIQGTTRRRIDLDDHSQDLIERLLSLQRVRQELHNVADKAQSRNGRCNSAICDIDLARNKCSHHKLSHINTSTTQSHEID